MNTITNLSAFETLKQAASTLNNPAVQEWRQQGGKVVGYFYSYIPEEIMTAAGLLPFRMRATGSDGTELADVYFTQINCSFVRHVFNSALQGDQDFLDGIIVFNYCDHMRRVYDNWKARVKTSFVHLALLPTKRGAPQLEVYRRELKKIKDGLEKQFNVEITDEKLRQAINLHNETRLLQRQLYELKKKDNVPISGADTLMIMVAATTMPKERYNQLLRQYLEELHNSEGKKTSTRLMLISGDHLDDPKFVELLESQGATVVTDTLSYGTKAFAADVANTGDPLDALANHYFNEQPACPRIVETGQDRRDYVEKMFRDFNVDGIVSMRLPFCDPWAFEQENMTKFLKTKDIPHLKLDSEYVVSGIGQIKTRVQAFMEAIAGSRNSK